MNEKVYIPEKYQDYVILGLLILMAIFGYFNQNNTYILEIFITSFIILFSLWFIFYDIDKLEKFLLSHFTKIIFGMILILLFTNFSYIEISKEVLYLIGGLFAFWYGYKKYERDKELEIIDKYSNKFNEINNDLYFLKLDAKVNKDKIKRRYSDLFNLFYEEYYLKCKGFISNELWNEWSDWIEIEIHNFLKYSIYKLYDLGDDDIFIGYIYGTYLQQYGNNNIKEKGVSFLDFIDGKIINIKNQHKSEIETKKLEYDKKEYSKMKDYISWLEAILESNKKMKEKIKT